MQRRSPFVTVRPASTRFCTCPIRRSFTGVARSPATPTGGLRKTKMLSTRLGSGLFMWVGATLSDGEQSVVAGDPNRRLAQDEDAVHAAGVGAVDVDGATHLRWAHERSGRHQAGIEHGDDKGRVGGEVVVVVGEDKR